MRVATLDDIIGTHAPTGAVVKERTVKELRFWLGPARTDFLYMDAACVLLGVGTAAWTSGKLNLAYILLAFLGALAAHVSVNALNEYFDFRSGLDLGSDRTPFSGGSGTLRERPDLARVALGMGLGSLTIAGTRTTQRGERPMKEVYSLSADGKVLTIVSTRTGQQGETTRKQVFNKK